jgi:hypothetical protein
MASKLYEDLAVEELLQSQFAFTQEIKKILLRDIPVSPTLEATVFKTTKNQLYVLIAGRARTSLGDMQKIIRRMGLKAESFLPPKGDNDYFTRFATKQFIATYPGRRPSSDSDLRYFKTLTPYSPALANISEVTSGIIKQYDTDAASDWRPVLEHSFRRIKAR